MPEPEELIQATPRDQGYLLGAAVCRRYVFIPEFAIEVVREHHLLRRLQVSFQDYDAFYGTKALGHAELDALALSTQKKLRQRPEFLDTCGRRRGQDDRSRTPSVTREPPSRPARIHGGGDRRPDEGRRQVQSAVCERADRFACEKPDGLIQIANCLHTALRRRDGLAEVVVEAEAEPAATQSARAAAAGPPVTDASQPSLPSSLGRTSRGR